MKLFIKPGACSMASHIVLEETGLPYETEVVDLQTKQTASGQDFWAINPKGYVPALQLDDGTLLTEGPAIVQYLADQVPAKPLAPANGTLARYQLQGWLTFIGTELHRSFGPFFNPAGTPEWQEVSRGNLQRRFAYVNDQLAGRDHLMGPDFSVADAYLFTVLCWTGRIGLDLAPWPNLVAFRERVAARPAVQAVVKAEGLT